MAKRGRPHKDGARYPSGELRREGDPTPEHAARRLALIGSPARSIDEPGFMAEAKAAKLASYPLGILYARGIISSDEHYAGRRYISLFCRAVRPLTIHSMLATLIAGGGVAAALLMIGDTVEHGAEDRTAYLDARQMLARRGRAVALTVDEIVIYENVGVAGLIVARQPRGAEKLHRLQDGLGTLKRHFDEADERQRALTQR